MQLTDDLGSHEPFSETCARRSREACALSAHARDIADWLDEHPEILTDSRLRRQRDNLRHAAHTLDDVRQGLRDAARSAAA